MLKASVSSSDLISSELCALSIELFELLHKNFYDGTGISRETYGATESSAMGIIEKNSENKWIEHFVGCGRESIDSLLDSSNKCNTLASKGFQGR